MEIGVMETEFAPAQISIPEWLATHLRQISDAHYSRKLNRMYVHMLESFLAYEPWKANPPFVWRHPRAHRGVGTSSRPSADPGWIRMTMQLPCGLVDRVKMHLYGVNNSSLRLRLSGDLSLSSFIYTAVCWWCIAVYPYEGPGPRLIRND